jgi:uncharacterized protein (DUF849 family)
MSSAVIACAITGPIATRDHNPNLPITPEEIAESARLAHEAGAAVVHIHVRDEQDTLMLRRGVPASSNAELVERLVGVARSLEREPATVAEVEERLRLPASAS